MRKQIPYHMNLTLYIESIESQLTRLQEINGVYREALEWIAGKSDKPYCTYYERVLDDGTEVPIVDDVAEAALDKAKELAEE